MNGENETTERQRSRAYPAHDLKGALEKAEAVRAFAGFRWAPLEIVIDNWGYGAKSSRGGRAAAALLQYGLLEDEGSRETRKVRLTALARKIMEHPSASERRQALREAALNPPLFREIWDQNDGQLPNDDLLRWELTSGDALNENAVDTFIRNLRGTVSFAGLNEGRTLEDEGEDPPYDGAGEESSDTGRGDPPPPPPPPPPPGRTAMPEPTYKEANPYDLPILLPTGETAILRMPDRQSPQTFRHLVKALRLNLMLLQAAVTRGQGTEGTEAGVAADDPQLEEDWLDEEGRE